MQNGASNPRWRGGRSTSGLGYVLVTAHDHPNARKSGYILEHRLIMSNHLKRPLKENELVHHINGIITDNRLENLAIMARGEHAAKHGGSGPQHRWWRGGKKPKTCSHCGEQFILRWGNHYRKCTKYCSIACRNAAQVGENGANAKLADQEVALIRERGAAGATHRALAKSFNISKTQVGRLLRRESRA